MAEKSITWFADQYLVRKRIGDDYAPLLGRFQVFQERIDKMGGIDEVNSLGYRVATSIGYTRLMNSPLSVYEQLLIKAFPDDRERSLLLALSQPGFADIRYCTLDSVHRFQHAFIEYLDSLCQGKIEELQKVVDSLNIRRKAGVWCMGVGIPLALFTPALFGIVGAFSLFEGAHQFFAAKGKAKDLSAFIHYCERCKKFEVNKLSARESISWEDKSSGQIVNLGVNRGTTSVVGSSYSVAITLAPFLPVFEYYELSTGSSYNRPRWYLGVSAGHHQKTRR